MARYVIGTPEEMMALGALLAARLAGGCVVALAGAMGSGKTTFCRGLGQGLGVQDPVSSPTYTIANYYRGAVPLAHFDATRVQGPQDFEAAGFYDYLDGGAVVAVEWSENVAALLEEPLVHVDIAVLEGGAREVTIEGVAQL
ncbi:MAG: tRNA (adenosine(37)-N6)-threonylcarbamoyltransferase complex ATPase subunit type 1 TsaE [Oscillospiraceae bacterium]